MMNTSFLLSCNYCLSWSYKRIKNTVAYKNSNEIQVEYTNFNNFTLPLPHSKIFMTFHSFLISFSSASVLLLISLQKMHDRFIFKCGRFCILKMILTAILKISKVIIRILSKLWGNKTIKTGVCINGKRFIITRWPKGILWWILLLGD